MKIVILVIPDCLSLVDAGDHGTGRHLEEGERTGRSKTEAETDPHSSVPRTLTGRRVPANSTDSRVNVRPLVAVLADCHST